MSTILIDRRTAVLLGELASAPPRPRPLDFTAVDGVALGVQVAGRPTSATPGGGGPTRRPTATSTRRSAHRREEESDRGHGVTVRQSSAAETRLRHRLRCEPRTGRAENNGARRSPTRSGRAPVRRRGAVHLTRRGRLVALLLFLVVLTVAFSVGRVSSTAVGNGTGAGAEVVVQRGDTLWSIAERIAPNADPRTTATDLMAVNGLGSPSLEVGQHLRLP